MSDADQPDLGQWFHGTSGLQLLVAAIIWLKGILVARHFLAVRDAHPFIRRLVYGFIGITPVVLVLTTYFSAEFARWATL